MLPLDQPINKHETAMISLSRYLPKILLAAGLMTSPLWAQDTSPGATGAAPSDLSTGVPVATDAQADDGYIREVHGAWAMRCLKTETGNEPCELYQLLKDDEGNSVAEITLFALPEGQQAVAGATIATPLETLLTAQLTLSVDGAAGKRYPFSYCTVQGCYARIGLTGEDIDAFRKGAAVTMTVVPAVAPDQKVNLNLSLAGFTSGFAAILQLFRTR